MRSAIACILFLVICTLVTINRSQVTSQIFYHYDKGGYYLYLPAKFIYNDMARFDFQPKMRATYAIEGGDYYALHDMPNGRRLNKYPVGTALFETPAFIIAHFYCLNMTDKHPADGYSDPYEFALLYGSILWSFIGLLMLRRFLLRHFSDTISCLVILCIGFGTNFYTYTAFDAGMSHTYSFFAFAGLLLYTDKWYEKSKRTDLYMIGVMLGLIFILRPVNIIAAIIPIGWGLTNRQEFKERLQLLWQRKGDVIIATGLFMLVAGIQLYYWKRASGHWLFFAYKGEEFNFMEPRIMKGLFSFRKGWFIYTPIAFVAIASLFITPRKYVPVLAIFFCAMVYVVFSWENWYYGGGFSARALIETLPVVAFPLAFFISKNIVNGKMIKRIGCSILLTFFIALNLFQTYQYSYGTVHYDRMSWDYYWRIFGKVRASQEDWQHLMPESEYFNEINYYNNN